MGAVTLTQIQRQAQCVSSPLLSNVHLAKNKNNHQIYLLIHHTEKKKHKSSSLSSFSYVVGLVLSEPLEQSVFGVPSLELSC